jgi:glyoxylase-like metal-dependent hydrolase (beta-lactamase superfamily II)
MNAIDRNDGHLKWDVLTSKRPGLSRDLPPGKEDLLWVSNSSTLIYGERDAVLVDTFLTIDQSRTLLDWVIASGKNLTAIYLTHGHGDHIFGVGTILERFPDAKAVATPEVVAGNNKVMEMVIEAGKTRLSAPSPAPSQREPRLLEGSKKGAGNPQHPSAPSRVTTDLVTVP